MAIKISGSTIIDDSRNIVNAGVVTATSFSGDGSGLTGVGVGASDNVNTTGIITASSFVGNLTGNATGLTGNPDVTVGVLTATTISTGGTTGTAGQVLQSTGTGVTWATAAGGISASDSNVIGYNSAGIRSDSANGRLEVFGTGNFQVFTSPGTYVVNPGISSIRVRVIGAGGNGGSGGSTGPNPPGINGYAGGGGGGGGGGYAHKVITSFSAPRTYTVTVGTAPGGTSSFGSEVSATGGSNGGNATPIPGVSPTPPALGGAGGSGSGGDVNFTGASGANGPQLQFSFGGNGGAAATQKGNGSGRSVPGLPSINVRPQIRECVSSPTVSTVQITDGSFRDTSINRFPFDIFNGMEGLEFLGPPTSNSPGASSIGNSSRSLLNSKLLGGLNGGGGTTGLRNSGPSTAPSIGGNGGTAGGGGGGMQLDTYVGMPGGNGGLGAGGGGGGGAFNFPGPQQAGSGGTGGAGIVIVEW